MKTNTILFAVGAILLGQMALAAPRSVRCVSYSQRCKLQIQYVSAQDEVKLEVLNHPMAKDCGLSPHQKLHLKPAADQNTNGWQQFQGYSAKDDRTVQFRFNAPVMNESVFQARLPISLQGSSTAYFENSVTCQ